MSDHEHSPQQKHYNEYLDSFDAYSHFPSSTINSQFHETNQLQSSFNNSLHNSQQKQASLNQKSPLNRQPCFDTFQHQTAIEIMIKLAERNFSRFFIKGLTFAYIQSLKSEQRRTEEQMKQIQENASFVQQTLPLDNKPINWPFKELYLLEYRTPQQQQMFQFVNLCAQIIQTNFKRYITQKRHKLALKRTKKAHTALTALVRGWKAHRVYNSKKCFEIREQISHAQKQIDLQQENYSRRDAKKLKMLYKYVEVHTKLFQETYSLYMETGAWVFEANMKPKINRHYSKPSIIPTLAESRPIVHTKHYQTAYSSGGDKSNENYNKSNIPIIPNHHDSGKSSKVILNPLIDNNLAMNPLEERPICAKGAYVYDEKEMNVPQKKTKEIKKQKQAECIEQNQQNEKQRARREEKERQKKKMQKRQKYDPRKAIQDEKKRKKQQQKQVKQIKVKTQKVAEKKETIKCHTEENQVPDHIQKQQNRQASPKSAISKTPKPDKKKIKITNNKPMNHKKVKSKIDCWATEKQPEPEWVKQYKTRMILQQNKIEVQATMKIKQQILEENTSIGHNKKIHTLKERHAQKRIEKKDDEENPRFEYSWQKKQIESLKNHHEHHEEMPRQNSTQQLREQLKVIHERNMASKNNFHRNIVQLEQAYGSAYTERYQRLLPKLQLLSYARGVQKESRIPVIDEESEQLYNQFGYIEKSSGHFWALCSNHEKVFRGFLQRNLNN